MLLALFAAALQTAPIAAAPPPAPAEKPICRRETPTGSIMEKRVCHSKADWAAIDGERGSAAHDAIEKRGRPFNRY